MRQFAYDFRVQTGEGGEVFFYRLSTPPEMGAINVPTSFVFTLGNSPGHSGILCPIAARRHAVMEMVGSSVTLIDLGCGSQTTYNGVNISKIGVSKGAKINVGGTIIEYLGHEVTTTTTTRPLSLVQSSPFTEKETTSVPTKKATPTTKKRDHSRLPPIEVLDGKANQYGQINLRGTQLANLIRLAIRHGESTRVTRRSTKEALEAFLSGLGQEAHHYLTPEPS